MRLQLKRNDKIGLLFFVAFVLATSLIYQFEERFDQDQWRSKRAVRYKLADDIIESQLLIGKTKDEVIALLGKPDSILNLNQESFLYDMGIPPSFLEPKMELLLIVFVSQKVAEVMRMQE
jgi:hypothetical protein